MQLLPIPILEDNYAWLMHDMHGHALVVDPGEAGPVARAVNEHELTLTHILLTHHHQDHIGGSAALAERFGAAIVAPDDPRIAHVNQRVTDGTCVQIPGPDWRFHVLSIPAHTRTHVAYFGEGVLFSGDTLFSLGCGRIFEGTPRDLLLALDRLSVLPGDTLLCCGHEYTLANGAFALTVEPGNEALIRRVEQARLLLASGRASLPSTLEDERRTNPFLRVSSDAVQAWAAARGADATRVSRLAALRAAKDDFRP